MIAFGVLLNWRGGGCISKPCSSMIQRMIKIISISTSYKYSFRSSKQFYERRKLNNPAIPDMRILKIILEML